MADPTRKPGHRFNSIQKLLQGAGADRHAGFTRVIAHARELDRLDQILASVLDSRLAPHCQVAEFRHHCLVLACSHATYAMRIRMISQQLLESLPEAGVYGIEHIVTHVAPVNRPQPEVHKPRTLSAAAMQALGRFAADSGDAEIQATFDRIIARRNVGR